MAIIYLNRPVQPGDPAGAVYDPARAAQAAATETTGTVDAPNTINLPEGALQPTASEQSGSRKVISLIDSLLTSPVAPTGTTVTPAVPISSVGATFCNCGDIVVPVGKLGVPPAKLSIRLTAFALPVCSV